MLTKRIIACLDVDAGRVVKGRQFVAVRDAGDPAELARAHADAGADELVLLDITATHQGRATLVETVRQTAQVLFVPLTVGGGVRNLEDASAIFDRGADKITINSAALLNPELIGMIAGRFGSQAVVVAIDAKRQGSGWRVWRSGGRIKTELDVIAWAKEAERCGAGELLVTSIDRDGTGAGFDCELTRAVAQVVSIPVIASGGAGGSAHFIEVFEHGRADAALAASIFHFGLSSIATLKRELQAAGIPVRPLC